MSVLNSEPAAVKPSNDIDYLGYLDGLRALCALFVVLHHAYLTVWSIAFHRMPPSSVLAYTSWIIHGTSAVGIFIVISGFCLMLPVLKNDLVLKHGALTFFKKRARRILPPYYAALIFSLLLAVFVIHTKTAAQWDVSIPVTLRGVWSHLFLLNDALGDSSINYVFWSIAVEWRIYFIFPLIVILWRKWGAFLTAAATLIFAYILRYVTNHMGYGGVMAHYLGLFALGMLAATIAVSQDPKWVSIKGRVSWGVILLALTLGLIVLHKLLGWESFAAKYVWTDLIIGFWSFALLIYASFPGRIAWPLNTRLFTWIGTFAYSLYLIHAPLLQLIWQYLLVPLKLPGILSYLLIVGIGMPVVVVVSYLFYLCFEKPFITKRHASHSP